MLAFEAAEAVSVFTAASLVGTAADEAVTTKAETAAASLLKLKPIKIPFPCADSAKPKAVQKNVHRSTFIFSLTD